MGLLATALSALLWSGAPAAFTGLDWALYDVWLHHRAPLPVSPSLVIMIRDPVSEEAFGTGPWDRAVLARLLTAAEEAGAAAIGLDHRLDHASPAQLGGAASDALLLEAIKTVPHLILTQHDADAPLLSDEVRAGHLHVATDADRITRSVPTATEGSQAVPPFGMALFQLVAPPAGAGSDHPETLLVNYAGNGTLHALPTLPVSAVWSAIETHNTEQLTEWFSRTVVVVLSDPATVSGVLLPTGYTVSTAVTHLHLLNMLLSDARLSALGTASRMLIPLIVTGLIAWVMIQGRGMTGWVIAAAAVLAYGGLVLGALALAHIVLPLALPLSGGLLVMLAASAWNQLTSHQRLRLMEQDMRRLQQEAAAVREALVLRETRAETLKEDLAVARAAIEQSSGEHETLAHTADQLRSHLAAVQAQEEQARAKLEELERQLHDLQAASRDPVMLDDAELDRLREECRQLGIITQDTGLLRLYRDLKQGAKSSLSVLLLGEPGTGKELFARAVHRLSPRAGKTFIAVNMAAISPELFESELFGHVRGSFTGATSDRRGYFELANHGTIFLDEIGDLRVDHQSKLLRVLQEQSFYRVGATSPTTVNVRIVAATNRELPRGVTDGWFREDLYFRLTGLVFRLPPLRERAGDVPLLADRFLYDIAAQLGKPMPALTNEAVQALLEQEWKGNVRELRHCLEQAVALSDTPLLTRDALRLVNDPLPASGGRARPAMSPDSAGDAAVLACLRQHGFDMQDTAKTLGWDRSTVTQRLKGLCFQALVESNGDQANAAVAVAGDPTHLRTVELKLMDYHSHLLSVIEPFPSAEDAIADCRRRFKNLPDRHFASVETLVKRYFDSVKTRAE